MTRRMRTSRAGIDLLTSFEGFRPRAVRLPGDRWLIGFGHTRTARKGATMSRTDALLMLREYDLAPYEKAIAAWVLAPLHQNEFDALVSFAFNIGLKAFRSSSVLAHLNSGQKLAAAEAMSAWRKARLDGRLIVVDALVRRRAAERALFLEHPSGRPNLPSALMRPVLDVGAAILSPREQAVLVESEFNDDRASTKSRAVIVDEDIEAEDPDQTAPVPARVSDLQSPKSPTAPERAAVRTTERMSRLVTDEDGDIDSGPRPERDSALDASRTEPSIEEITAAVSALAEPNGDVGIDAREAPKPQSRDDQVERRPLPGRPVNPPRPVDYDEVESAEAAMRRIEDEYRNQGKVPGAAHPTGSGRAIWGALSVTGVLAMVWGVADRLAWLPDGLRLTGTALDIMPPVIVLAGLVAAGWGVWNLAEGGDN